LTVRDPEVIRSAADDYVAPAVIDFCVALLDHNYIWTQRAAGVPAARFSVGARSADVREPHEPGHVKVTEALCPALSVPVMVRAVPLQFVST
jgi:hypothetical protein